MNNTEFSSRWFVRPKVSERAEFRLFCFPYAGGSANIFHRWSKLLPDAVEICAVQMPARGSRLNEAAYQKIGDLVRVLAEKISFSDDTPFAFFGHSLGATVAFELSFYLRKIGHRQPSHLFVSGRCAPQTDEKRPPTYQLSDAEFTEDIRRLGGTPPEILENTELMQLLLPALRADFRMVQTYEYQTGKPLSCPISAFGGLRDDFVKPENLAAWREQTTGKFVCRMIEGDHFFLNFQAQKIARFITEDLSTGGFPI